jgi:signal transduction histidine kinase
MVPWYLFLGRPLMMQDQPATRKAIVYLAGLVVLFAVAQSQVANAWVLAFGLVPMCFHVTTARRAMVFVVIINVIGGALEAWRNPGLAGALIALGIAAFAIAFAYVYSRWMARVIAQSLDRAALIEQLEATRAELAAAHHEAGVQAERHRLAGEIHDTLAQGFTSIVTLLQAGQASLDAASPARRHLDLALLTARENLAEARTLVTALTPATLEAGTLGDAVHRVTSATGAQAGIEAHAEVTGTARLLPTGTEVVLLRVCQEALANVRKHAGARQVRVRLCYAGTTVRLTVTDDGKGFDPGTTHGGYGLTGMRDRVSQVGGTVEVASVPGRGTEVSAEVPG